MFSLRHIYKNDLNVLIEIRPVFTVGAWTKPGLGQRYLSSFYKNALEENVTGVHLNRTMTLIFFLRDVRARFF